MKLSRAILKTPLDDMLALSSYSALCALEFTGPRRRLPRLDARLRRWFPPHDVVDEDAPVIRKAREWLRAYFDGASADIDGIPLDMRGAPFELRVWQALRTIPPGQTTSYGAIAKAVGSPDAARAPGAAHGAKPSATILPPHPAIGPPRAPT